MQAAMAAVRDCADTMEAQANGLLAAIAGLPMDAALRATAVGLCATLKDRAGRVTFELALLETELGEAERTEATVVRRLVTLDVTMMDALAPLAELADRLECAAERDARQERAFVRVLEAAGGMLQRLDQARAATATVARHLGPDASVQ